MNDQEFDFFICHASEDKAEIAEPLSEMLKKKDMKIWFDKEQLKVGDSLTAEIQKGLKKSVCGVVIISPAFLKKDSWNKLELATLINMKTLCVYTK